MLVELHHRCDKFILPHTWRCDLRSCGPWPVINKKEKLTFIYHLHTYAEWMCFFVTNINIQNGFSPPFSLFLLVRHLFFRKESKNKFSISVSFPIENDNNVHLFSAFSGLLRPFSCSYLDLFFFFSERREHKFFVESPRWRGWDGQWRAVTTPSQKLCATHPQTDFMGCKEMEVMLLM